MSHYSRYESVTLKKIFICSTSVIVASVVCKMVMILLFAVLNIGYIVSLPDKLQQILFFIFVIVSLLGGLIVFLFMNKYMAKVILNRNGDQVNLPK